MFKKQPNIKAAAPLRSSDRRRLADQCIKDCNLESPADEGQLSAEQKAEAAAAHTQLRNSLLPENTQAARFSTTHGPDLVKVNGSVYIGSHSSHEEPRILWWSVERGDSRLYPSVYTLWRHPGLVPLLHTPDVVIGKLKGGADLMTPGLADRPPFPSAAKKGAVVAVAGLEHPSVPVAVGVCEIDVSELGDVRGMKGRAVESLQWFGDELWGWSGSGKAGISAPESIEGWEKVMEGMNALDLDDDDVGDENEGGGVKLEDGREVQPTAADDKDSLDHHDEGLMSQTEIDAAFRNAFLYGIHHHKTTQTNTLNFGLVYPLGQSVIISSLIQPFLQTFTVSQTQQLQIKNTSWKNVKKFVKALDKEGLLKSKDKDKHETVILDINFADQSITAFRPYRLPKKVSAQGKDSDQNEQPESADDSIGQKLTVHAYHKPTSKLQPLFLGSNKQFFAPAEIRELIASYIERESLTNATNKRLVKLDPFISNSIFDGSNALDKEVLAKGTVPVDALTNRVLKALPTCYAITRSGSDPAKLKPKTGVPPKVLITLETRSGSKTVTKVSGLEAYFISPRPLADELRKVCAGSTSVEPLAGATKKGEKEIMEVMVQGPQKEVVLKALEKRGVRSQWVEVLDKVKKGKGR